MLFHEPLVWIQEDLTWLQKTKTAQLPWWCYTARGSWINQTSWMGSQFPDKQAKQLVCQYPCFLVTIFPPIAWHHFLHINTHTQLLHSLWQRANARNVSFETKITFCVSCSKHLCPEMHAVTKMADFTKFRHTEWMLTDLRIFANFS